jgi:hypothetical protein
MRGKLTFANTVERFDAGDCDGVKGQDECQSTAPLTPLPHANSLLCA